MTATNPGQAVQVVMPAALLPRLVEPLAMIGMRLYQLPTKDGPTLMIAADLTELRDPDEPASLTTADVLEAWSFAVESLAEAAAEAKRPKTRKRRAA
ncbi:hypothetical protein AB0C10_37050 [Microbispora amethystogenes]|uniref:hypothetical protein n=1 Tax=Microbispora amethystogenes TaxID=1427754 RepID=UPI0033E9A90D